MVRWRYYLLYGILAIVAVLLYFGTSGGWPHWIAFALGGFVLWGLYGVFNNYRGYEAPVRDLNNNWAADKNIRGMCHGTVWRVTAANSKSRVDFTKLIHGVERTRFFLRLDSRYCSPEEFRAAQEAFLRKGIDFEIEEDPKKNRRLLIVECGRDVDKALAVERTVLTEGFGLGPDDKVRISFMGGVNLWPGANIGWEREIEEEKMAEGRVPIPPVGTHGEILSAGRAEFDGKVFDVLCRGGLIDPGTEVEIVKIDGDQIVVQKVTETEDNDTKKE